MSKTRFTRLIRQLEIYSSPANPIVAVILLELYNQIKIQKEFICQLEERVDQLEHRTSGHQGFLG